jgi:pimeloyl-ACP methyl ester carboxylesterase
MFFLFSKNIFYFFQFSLLTRHTVVGPTPPQMPAVKAFPQDHHVRIRANEKVPIDLHVRTYGDPSHPAILAVAGFGANKEVGCENSFYKRLADRNLFVVSFSNRDAGGSTKMSHLPTRSMTSTLLLAALAGLLPPSVTTVVVLYCMRNYRSPMAQTVAGAVLALFTGFKAYGGTKAFHLKPAYTLEDVADDIPLLMNQMNIEKAHIMGTSMGGMLAQTAVLRHPERFLSLGSVMSNTGANSIIGLPDYPLSTLLYLYVVHPMSRPDPEDYDAMIKYESEGIKFQLQRAKDGTATFNEGLTVMQEAKRRYDAHTKYDTLQSRKDSMGRQMDGIAWQQGDRTAELKNIQIPTVVVHGMEDKLIPATSGLETASAIGLPACRRVVLVPECGHTYDDIFSIPCVDAIAENIHFAEDTMKSRSSGVLVRSKL